YEQVLGDFASVQKAVAAEIELEKISSPDAFDRMMSTAAIHRMLASKVAGAARELVGVNLWNLDGQLLNASQEWPVARRSVAQRKYFNVLKSGATDQSLVVELVTSQFVDGRALVFAQKITSPNGEFLGVITRSLSPKNFENFFASVALGPDAAIALVHADGTLIARHPQADHLVGRNIIASSQYERFREASATVWTSGPVDGAARFAAPAQLKAFP